MDAYFIVAELDIPLRSMDVWLYDEPSTIALLEEAEGDVTVTVTGSRFVLRTYLIDAAYFSVARELAAAFTRAEALGAKGRWYSGDHVSGTLGTLGKPPAKVKVRDLPKDVTAWVREAGELGERGDDMRASEPKKKRAPAKKKAVPKKKAAKKSAATKKKTATKKAAPKTRRSR
jgi:hypothetical protein